MSTTPREHTSSPTNVPNKDKHVVGFDEELAEEGVSVVGLLLLYRWS
jgi:hypothetical protein